MTTGPIHRSVFPCYDCDAQPGERHAIRCALTPWMIEEFHIGLTDVWGPYYGDNARDTWAGSDECMWCGEGDDPELGTVVQAYHPACLASANDPDRPLALSVDDQPRAMSVDRDDTLAIEIGDRAHGQLADENQAHDPLVIEVGYTPDTWLTEVWTQASPFEFQL